MNNNLLEATIDRINKITNLYKGETAKTFCNAIDASIFTLAKSLSNTKNYDTVAHVIIILSFIEDDIKAHITAERIMKECNTDITKPTNVTGSDGN